MPPSCPMSFQVFPSDAERMSVVRLRRRFMSVLRRDASLAVHRGAYRILALKIHGSTSDWLPAAARAARNRRRASAGDTGAETVAAFSSLVQGQVQLQHVDARRGADDRAGVVGEPTDQRGTCSTETFLAAATRAAWKYAASGLMSGSSPEPEADTRSAGTGCSSVALRPRPVPSLLAAGPGSWCRGSSPPPRRPCSRRPTGGEGILLRGERLRDQLRADHGRCRGRTPGFPPPGAGRASWPRPQTATG